MRTTHVIKLSAAATLLLALSALATPALSQTSPAKPMTDTEHLPKHLLVIGASYASGWKQPELPGYRVTNKGVGGEESWQVAARFERDALATKSDYVLIWGHINDITRSSPDKYNFAKQRAIKSYQQMLAQARAAQTPVILATELTLPTAIGWRDWIPATIAKIRGKESYAQTVNREVKAVNAWLRQTAVQEKILLLDFEKAVDDGNGGRKPEYTQEDRSHVTAAGYAAITQYARQQLQR